MSIQLKRIYEVAAETDGKRILVDRIWPRGISKEKAALDYWLKEVAPTKELRKWFGHDPDKFLEFKRKYQDELSTGIQNKTFQELKAIITQSKENVTILYGAKDETHNQAQILLEMLENA